MSDYVDIATIRPDPKSMGSYVHVYARGGICAADLQFFDGDRSLDELRLLRSALDKAIVKMQGHMAAEARR